MIQAHYMYCALYVYYDYISSTSDHQALDPRGEGPQPLKMCRKGLVAGLCWGFQWSTHKALSSPPESGTNRKIGHWGQANRDENVSSLWKKPCRTWLQVCGHKDLPHFIPYARPAWRHHKVGSAEPTHPDYCLDCV